jgi:phosphoenolpyruvate phosphomutase
MTTNVAESTTAGTASEQLRELLTGPEPSPIMGVYDGLSARIAADAGFGAVWASGLCMSTALGVRDSDEASWTDLLMLVSRIVEAAGVPVLVDGDAGYGNFNTARRFAVSAERIGAAGICLEDKTFPKMNSFVGNRHRLASVKEFCGKIEACREALRDPRFVIVARVEALIAGAGLPEALQRAEAYQQAGADAIFIHSRQSTINEIAAFASAWHNRLPLVVAPTTYYDTPSEVFADLGIGAVIWANQSMRAAVSAIRQTCRLLQVDGPTSVEERIAPLDEVFELLNYKQLTVDEERYGS